MLDDSCFDMVLLAPLDMCLTEDAWPPALECEAFAGSKAEGEDCSPTLGLPLLRVNECGGELICVGGKCTPSGTPAVPKASGDACVHETPGSCANVELFCADDNHCHLRGVDGDACDSPDECFDPTFAASLYCAGITGESGSCRAQVSVGGACDPLDYLPCMTTFEGETMTPSYCEPSSKTCVEGRAPVVCEALDVPRAWP
jgi:hypothetical protein